MKHNNKDIQWCIIHECYDEVINNIHVEIENNRPVSCQGPFAECEPPQLEENWQNHLIEQSPIEDMFDKFARQDAINSLML